ncbi:MAG: hypothetical protein LRZ84_19690 [Desertifilum sp.]|nr:hypothetical protein [Desertifilum sp.]
MTQQTASGRWRIGAATTPFAQVAIAVSLNAVTQEMAIVRNIFAVTIPGVLLLVAGGAWAIAGSSLSSIQRLTQVVANVTANGLEQRVPIESADLEFIELIQVFNQGNCAIASGRFKPRSALTRTNPLHHDPVFYYTKTPTHRLRDSA